MENDNHNHHGSAVNNEVRLFNDKLYSRAISTTESTQHVIDYSLNGVSDQMVARLPSFKHIKRNIQRQRLENDLPPIPHDTNFTMIPTSLTLTSKNDKFLQFDSGPGDNRLVIFASFNQLEILEQIFALLTDKRQLTYERLIDELCRLCPSWNPTSVMVDFEKAAINAFQKRFGTTTNPLPISACFFHLQKSIQRKLQLQLYRLFWDLGLKSNYENDSQFAYDVNKIAALAFLQCQNVSQGFDDLYTSLSSVHEPLLNYFEDTYIGRRRPNGRAKPRYPIELWNMHERTINGAMRTNNQAEAWHRRFNSAIECEHPSL
ncbi:unnamed protein product [Adineta ricciae]|uniref:MULE transposase domain-containing protein n=1 Tax=Adineta ricciae TaxID=249248 RepID=A0A815XWR1_ADIRI|nr:unnamed protein product [Adineta ricciae]CAF1562999.1 unnamed protein product [Adineta ricciae]